MNHIFRIGEIMTNKTMKCTYKAISKDVGRIYKLFKDDYDWCVDNISAIIHMTFLVTIIILPFVIAGVLAIEKLIHIYIYAITLPLTFIWMYIVNKYIDCSEYWINGFKTGFKSNDE